MPAYDVLLALGGLLAGVMVGLTGMGGAVLVTPLLVVGFGVPPAAAVSSDVVVNALVKPLGSAIHLRRGTPHLGLVLWLSVGSVPGVVLGTVLFSHFVGDPGGTDWLKGAIAWTLIIALGAMVARSALSRHTPPINIGPSNTASGQDVPVRRVLTTTVGAMVGFLVGITSVGSGSLVVTSLLLFYPMLRPSVVVGTDLLQAVPMLLAGALTHASLGAVDWRITATLLLGEIPGVWIGARLSSIYNGRALRYLLMAVLLATALKLLATVLVP